ncbi:ferritin-like domain-containing protein [Hydrogenophilus islandicus]
MTAENGAPPRESVHEAAYAVLLTPSPETKCAGAQSLWEGWQAGRYRCEPTRPLAPPLTAPRQPQRPVLLPPAQMPKRKVGTREGHAALLHAVAHIEFNAINLALDCVWRFPAMPEAFYADWLRIAAEEAAHFLLVCERLRALGYAYGDFPAHNGLWEMAVKTMSDPLARMALVPRVLEARGLDATPVIQEKLRQIGDHASIAVLETILRDEVGHVATGDRWFRWLCRERGLAPEATYLALVEAFDAPLPHPPVNWRDRERAGFARAEVAALLARRAARRGQRSPAI